MSNKSVRLDNVIKCHKCDKKLVILAFKCRCNHNFCNKHLIPELHNCIFDYKIYGKNIIAKASPKIIPEKVPII